MEGERPVLDREVLFTFSKGRLISIKDRSSHFKQIIKARMSAEEARALVLERLGEERPAGAVQLQAVILPRGESGVEGFELRLARGLRPLRLRIDAHARKIVSVQDMVLR